MDGYHSSSEGNKTGDCKTYILPRFNRVKPYVLLPNDVTYTGRCWLRL
jgi:hypothetical protein